MAKKKDSDFDGIPDTEDKYPYDYNNGKTYLGQGVNPYGNVETDIAPIYLPWLTDSAGQPMPVPGGSTQALRALAALRVNDRKKYGIVKAGIEYNLGRKVTDKDVDALWRKAVEWTQSPGTGDGNPVNYFNLLRPGDLEADSSGPRYGTQGFKNTQITEYSGSAAAQQISDEMERRLGRRATQAEIDAYTKGVNAAAKKDPSVTQGSTTTTAPKGKNTLGTSTTNQTAKTGFDPTMFARNFAMSRPDYAESFAANTFLGLVEKLLKDPNAIGQVIGDGR
jgi:hypothetical protein